MKVSDRCTVCSEELFHQRADDFPAYLVMLVVGHVIVGALLLTEVTLAPPMWLEMLIWPPATVITALALLQPTKGAVVGLQWHLGMHGFEQAKLQRSANAKAYAEKDFPD